MTGNIHITNYNFKNKFRYSSLACYSAYYGADKTKNSIYFLKIEIILLGVFVNFRQTLTVLSLMLELSVLVQRT